MRPYIGRYILSSGAAAVVVVAICLGWPVSDAVAQADDAAPTVRTCIGINVTIGPLEKALIKEDIIEEDLLQTRLTNGMCKDMLEPISDATPVRKLLVAQNYIQEIELIEGAMREAARETAAKGPNRGFSSAQSFFLFGAIAQMSAQVPGVEQYDEGPGGDGPGGGGPGGSGPGGGGTGGDGPGSIGPRKHQAAAAVEVGEDTDASIADRFRQKEATLKKEGASAPEAAAGGRCGLEVDILDEEVDKSEGLYTINPIMPQEMRHGETKPAGLLVSPVTKEMFQEIRQKHGLVAEASGSGTGCVKLADWMKATLVPHDQEKLVVDSHQPDDIRKLSSGRNTRWGWSISANHTGKLNLHLDLSYAISREGRDFRLIPKSPIYEEAIKVTPPKSDSNQKATEQKATTERPWWQRIFGGIFERLFGLFGD